MRTLTCLFVSVAVLLSFSAHLLFPKFFFCPFLFQPDSVLLLELAAVIDANQNHIKGNPFISYPTVPCNTPNDGPFSSSLALFRTPSPDPFSNDPFPPVNSQDDFLPLSSNCETGPLDGLLNRPIACNSLTGDSAPNGQLVKDLSDGWCPKNTVDAPVEFLSKNVKGSSPLSVPLQAPPFCTMFDKVVLPVLPTPSPFGSGLSQSLHLSVQTPPLCCGETAPPVVRNGGVMPLCPPPASSKHGHVQGRAKVNL
ncbi:disabled homolog 2-like [Electrophorus electricus]|uniref:disabled homolog 2-like n=1 Tax=Electrophorus electricus TaxID=8005 RepID=UPI0015D06764|nr:disabled homolog 2-like [Electrophorus electricus]